MPSPTQITDHVARAKATTRSQFHAAPILQAFLAAMVTEVQRAEDVTFLVITDRDIDDAEGVNLDLIGKIVGRARLDIATDDEYRAVLKVQIRANVSDCGAEDIIWIASELTGAAVLWYGLGEGADLRGRIDRLAPGHRRTPDLADRAGAGHVTATDSDQ